MYKLWARSRETTKYEWLTDFWDERQFDFECDTVDRDKYSEVMITDESGKHCLFHYEFKDYTPYFKKYGKVRGKRNEGR